MHREKAQGGSNFQIISRRVPLIYMLFLPLSLELRVILMMARSMSDNAVGHFRPLFNKYMLKYRIYFKFKLKDNN